MHLDLLRRTAAELQVLLSTGKLTSLDLVRHCHQQMLKHNDYLKAVISISPLSYTERLARLLDDERGQGHLRSPLHGIPLLVKDAYNTTAEFEVQSTNGGWAFEDSNPRETAQVIKLAVEAGLILVGKEYGNWKASSLSGGWSARGGQTQSSYVRGGVVDDGIFGHSNPSGSSTGSAVGVSAGFAPISIGADFNGSLTNPAIRAALYTLRTTPGTISEQGGFPFSVDLDALGPMAKSTEDLVNLLNVIVDTKMPNVPSGGFGKGIRRPWKDISIAILDPGHWYLPSTVQIQQPGTLEQIIRDTNAAYNQLGTLAKRVVGPVELISESTLNENYNDVMKQIVNDFSGLLDDYLHGLQTPRVRSLKELIAFNESHRDLELPPEHPFQDKLMQCVETPKLSEEEYVRLYQKTRKAGGEDAIDKTLREYEVDVIIGPADSRMPDVAALAGYPSVTLPLGYLDWNGRPFGLLALASKFQEELLIDVAKAWEEVFPPRQPPPLLENDQAKIK